ncbi:tRNA (guanosine(46)-N7)-methyltransferase TrmB [bacterium]
MRIRTHVNPLNFIKRMKQVNFNDILPKNSYLDLEIGFGRGIFLRNYAKKYSKRNIIGAEVRKPAVDLLRSKISSEKIQNVFLIHGEAKICLEDMINNESLDKIFIFHPDPWLKRRHAKRRIIQIDFMELLYKKLKQNGKIYISTDVKNLWIYILNVVEKHNKFTSLKNDDFWETDYLTHWNEFRQKDNRDFFYGTFIKLPLNK